LAQQLAQQQQGQFPEPEPLSETLAALALAISADGVMMPLRSQPRSPKGKIVWRAVKGAILARLGQRVTRSGKAVPKLRHRRLVAVLGDIDSFIPTLKLEAHRQSLESAPQVIWLSDGGRGFWRL
jgi:hypothetical protein